MATKLKIIEENVFLNGITEFFIFCLLLVYMF
jgi:hypothetical protein